jgi:hypothetical protein
MYEDVITAENVEKLRNLGLKWKFSDIKPDSAGQHTNSNKLWLLYEKQWYRYYSVNPGSLIFEFLHCNSTTAVRETINRLLKEKKLEV